MRVLLTGNRGYIGTVTGPMLSAAGHDVVGLDTDFYAACTFVGSVPEIPTIRRDLREATPADLEGFTPSSTWPPSRTILSATSTRK